MPGISYKARMEKCLQKFTVQEMQQGQERQGYEKCLQIYKNKKIELNFRDASLKLPSFKPFFLQSVSKFLGFRDTLETLWRHFLLLSLRVISQFGDTSLHGYHVNRLVESFQDTSMHSKSVSKCLYPRLEMSLSVSKVVVFSAQNWRMICH